MCAVAKDLQIRLKDDLLITSLDDREGIVLDVDSRSYFLVNETALFLLNLLSREAGSASCSALKDRLLEEYAVGEQEAARDISEFINALKDRSLASIV